MSFERIFWDFFVVSAIGIQHSRFRAEDGGEKRDLWKVDL